MQGPGVSDGAVGAAREHPPFGFGFDVGDGSLQRGQAAARFHRGDLHLPHEVIDGRLGLVQLRCEDVEGLSRRAPVGELRHVREDGDGQREESEQQGHDDGEDLVGLLAVEHEPVGHRPAEGDGDEGGAGPSPART
ncbi:hypothetical protein E1262_02505 [Jiangella aurantiaca]|uniref:Uncharacterized protein n=1 Tax=Jiangella aurantiaca TaxID=2530373 RepID=A0A4R5AQV3_9ACTN|nr:hypothetical protein [Jiangella aurantiaca]TDD72742.1 hypothetical protein E1262_02505 [Jiangella aurantiaca]